MGRSRVAVVHRDHVPGKPDDYCSADVQFAQGMIREGLNAIEWDPERCGRNVVIKVNACYDTPPGLHTTDPRTVEAVVRLLKEEARPERIVVAENASARQNLDTTGVGATTMECFEKTGIAAAAMAAGAELTALEEDEHIRVQVPRALVLEEVGCPRTLLDADTLIFLPHMKTHVLTTVTLALKLNQGSIPSLDKIRNHKADLAAKIVDLLRVVRPHLTIIDALWAQQGQGPVSPYGDDLVKDMNTIIMSEDPVSADAVASAIMGFEPLQVETTAIAHGEGLGTGDVGLIDIFGDLAAARRDFKRPRDELDGVFPKVLVSEGKPCRDGCIRGMLRMALDALRIEGSLESLPGQVAVHFGHHERIPEAMPSEETMLIVGDCNEHLRDRGIFVGGCENPPKVTFEFCNRILDLASG